MLEGCSIAASHGSSTSLPLAELLAQVAVREQHGATLRLPLRRVGNLRRIVLGEPRVRQRRAAATW